MPARMHADEVDVGEALVRRLLRAQLPHLADLPLAIVEPWGTDNAIWRLGGELVLRLPRIGWASGQPDFEATWLPRLAPHLPVAVPEPVTLGEADAEYPYRWAVHRWLPGEPASYDRLADPTAFATELAAVVLALRRVPTDGAPEARNRARPLAGYDADTRAAIDRAAHLIDAGAAGAVWDEALAARPHDGPPVWVHGDLEGNGILQGGRLTGLVDWGLACAGDPAVDVQVAWSPLFDERSRRTFLEAVAADGDTIARARGAAVHQACAALPYYLDTYPLIVERSWHKLAALGVGRRRGRRRGYRRRMADTGVVVEEAGPITRLTLDRPDRRNALSLDLMQELTAALRAAEGRVVVVAANGPAFSAGHDLSELVGSDTAAHARIFAACTELMETVQSIDQPVIAQVHGVATAAGCQLVASCDLAVAESGARFGTPGVRIGLFCSTPMVPLSRAIGPKRSMKMLLTGELVDAATALEWGLVNDVVEARDLRAAVDDLAERIASASPLTLAIGKKTFHRQLGLDQRQAYDLAAATMVANAGTADAQEGMGAFLEKRTPTWTGR